MDSIAGNSVNTLVYARAVGRESGWREMLVGWRLVGFCRGGFESSSDFTRRGGGSKEKDGLGNRALLCYVLLDLLASLFLLDYNIE